MTSTRRTVLTAAAWTVPAIAVAKAAPAFATSITDPPALKCEPVGHKLPGRVRAHTYRLALGCGTGVRALAVWIGGQEATAHPTDGTWSVERRDSRSTLDVHIVATGYAPWSGVVAFAPGHNAQDEE